MWVLCLQAGWNTDLRVVCVGVVFKDSKAAWNIDSMWVVCVGVVFTDSQTAWNIDSMGVVCVGVVFTDRLIVI